MSGAPFAIYHSYINNQYDLEAGIPVNNLIESSATIVCKVIPTQNTVMATFRGPYDKTSIAYESIERYLKDKKIAATGPPWETYITDPLSEPDTARWQTNVYFPVK
jgi:effector-binding domain-containing protein